MNSPFDALTIFTKFMSSPTDALEVISKVIQSPNDVLQFLQQLMRSPENGLEIMTKFMNAPAEALKMINNMMNQTARVDSTTGGGDASPAGGGGQAGGGEGQSNLIEIQPSDSIMNNSAQLKVILDRMGEHLSGGSPTSNMPSSSTIDGELELSAPVASSVDEERREEVNAFQAGNAAYLFPEPGEVNMTASAAPSTAGQTTTQDIIDMLINQTVNSMDSVILSEAIKLEYECALPITSGMPNASPSLYMSPLSSSSSGGGGGGGDLRPLNDVEQGKLNELILAHQALYAPVHEDISSLIADDYRLKVSVICCGNEERGW